MSRLILTILAGFLILSNAQALELTSVTPRNAEPGSPVVLRGGPFSAQTFIALGTRQITPSEVSKARMVFIVPDLAPGSYDLHIRDAQRSTPHKFEIEILEPTPQIISISPRKMDSCFDTAEQRITINASGVSAQTAVLLNGLSVAREYEAPDRISFYLQPGMKAGAFGVQLRNPTGTTSVPASIFISDQPEIFSIEPGDDFVTHYEVIVRGKNFYFNSILTVSQLDHTSMAHRPLILHAHERTPRFNQQPQFSQTDRIVYRDCQTLVYYRYPVDQQDKDLQLQLINPDGKKNCSLPDFPTLTLNAQSASRADLRSHRRQKKGLRNSNSQKEDFVFGKQESRFTELPKLQVSTPLALSFCAADISASNPVRASRASSSTCSSARLNQT